jgi:hypothetical protein
MAENKIYCGKGKKGQYDQINLNICLTDLPKEFIKEFKEKKYINLVVSQMKTTDDRGNTHTVTVNTWKPENKQANPEIKQEPESGDLPF